MVTVMYGLYWLSPQRDDMMNIPSRGFLRLKQIIGSPKHGIPPIIPVGRTAWWEGVKTGRYPKPVKLGPRTTAWRAKDILALIESVDADQEQGL